MTVVGRLNYPPIMAQPYSCFHAVASRRAYFALMYRELSLRCCVPCVCVCVCVFVCVRRLLMDLTTLTLPIIGVGGVGWLS
jgi:hypothetical protein